MNKFTSSLNQCFHFICHLGLISPLTQASKFNLLFRTKSKNHSYDNCFLANALFYIQGRSSLQSILEMRGNKWGLEWFHIEVDSGRKNSVFVRCGETAVTLDFSLYHWGYVSLNTWIKFYKPFALDSCVETKACVWTFARVRRCSAHSYPSICDAESQMIEVWLDSVARSLIRCDSSLQTAVDWVTAEWLWPALFWAGQVLCPSSPHY